MAKSKYMLLLDDEVNEDLHIYFVWIGENKRDARILAHLQTAAKANKRLFFEKFSDRCITFLQRLAEQLYSLDWQNYRQLLNFNCITITGKQAKQLVQL